jgi:hypothetical protein
MGGIMSMFSSMSDRRLKKDIRRAGETPNGTPLYRFRYVWEGPTSPERLGVMADEVEHIAGAVARDVHGYALVDYGKVIAHG